MEKFDTISHPPFLRSERFELYAGFEYILHQSFSFFRKCETGGGGGGNSYRGSGIYVPLRIQS